MKRILHFAISTLAFILSVYAVSHLMTLLLQTLESGLNLSSGISISEYAAVTTIGIIFLTRELYRLDRRAGRIRNRIGWFE